jgi:hypothetical protein
MQRRDIPAQALVQRRGRQPRAVGNRRRMTRTKLSGVRSSYASMASTMLPSTLRPRPVPVTRGDTDRMQHRHRGRLISRVTPAQLNPSATRLRSSAAFKATRSKPAPDGGT